MSFQLNFATSRTTVPDPGTLLINLRALDASASALQLSPALYSIGKSTTWTGLQITAAQNVLDTSAPITAELIAQTEIDNWSDTMKAFALSIIDQLNVIRAALPVPLPPITPAQAIAAIRAKAATL